MALREVTVDLVDDPCPLCGESDFQTYLTTLDHFYHVSGEFRIVRCSSCKHYYMNPRPSKASVFNCYPLDYAQHHRIEVVPSTSEPTRPWYAKPPIRWIPGLKWVYHFLTDKQATVIPNPPSAEKIALEFGCGTGAFLDELAAAEWQTKGLELSPGAAEECQRRGHQVDCKMIDDADFAADSLDAVFAWMVVEHLRDPKEVITRIRSWLKPGGTFCFSVPNFGSVQKHLFGQYWQCYDLPRHLQHFTSSRLANLLIECGYETPEIRFQRNLQSWFASLGALLKARNPKSAWGNYFEQIFETPPFQLQLVLAPLALVFAWCGQSDRLTIVARKPLD